MTRIVRPYTMQIAYTNHNIPNRVLLQCIKNIINFFDTSYAQTYLFLNLFRHAAMIYYYTLLLGDILRSIEPADRVYWREIFVWRRAQSMIDEDEGRYQNRLGNKNKCSKRKMTHWLLEYCIIV